VCFLVGESVILQLINILLSIETTGVYRMFYVSRNVCNPFWSHFLFFLVSFVSRPCLAGVLCTFSCNEFYSFVSKNLKKKKVCSPQCPCLHGGINGPHLITEDGGLVHGSQHPLLALRKEQQGGWALQWELQGERKLPSLTLLEVGD
jgi:hypothetical protein